ncbi:MAG: hypothetical protein VKL42_01395 [Snowella sp.]|nr:hypothetical protein [Snowella sp.]
MGEIGVIARPSEIRFTGVLPKTRSGKIMRRYIAEFSLWSENFGGHFNLSLA